MAERKTYTTKARTEILDYFKRNFSVTASASDVIRYLKEEGIKVNPTTVYRCLDRLCEEHLIIKYADPHAESALYQYSGEAGHCTSHLHLKCVRCGKVIHLDCGFMDELKGHLLSDHQFRLLCQGDLLHGFCGDCEKEAEQQENGEE